MTPWASRAALLAILAVTTAIRLRLLAVPLERDEGEFAYMGQLILRGELPYVAAYNMKLPGAYYAYAGIIALLGETDVAIRLGLLLANLAAVLLLGRLGRALLDPTAGLAAAAAYAVLSLSPSVLGLSAKAEHFVVLPVLGGALLLAGAEPGRSLARAGAAGLLFGLAVVTKQHAAAFVAFGAAWLLVRGRGGAARAIAVFLVGALVPFGLVCLRMAVAGAFAPFWFWTVTYARAYVSMIPLGDGLSLLQERAGDIVRSSAPLWLLVAAGATAPLWDAPARRAGGWLGLFCLCSFLAVCPGLRFSEHYFILLLPAASLLAGVGVSALVRAVAGRRPALAPAVALGLPLAAAGLSLWPERAVLLRLPPVAVARAVYGSNPFPEAVEIARWLRGRSAPDDRVAVIGSEPEVYFYAGRRAATGYIYMYPLMEEHPFARRMQEDLIAQLERERPRFLVMVNVDASWTRRAGSPELIFDWLTRAVAEDYEPVALAEIVPGGPSRYRWGEDARAAQPSTAAFVAAFERRS